MTVSRSGGSNELRSSCGSLELGLDETSTCRSHVLDRIDVNFRSPINRSGIQMPPASSAILQLGAGGVLRDGQWPKHFMNMFVLEQSCSMALNKCVSYCYRHLTGTEICQSGLSKPKLINSR